MGARVKPVTRKRTTAKLAVRLDNSGEDLSLVMRKVYTVLRDDEAESHGLLRVVDESGEDYLYPREWFALLQLPPALRQKLASIRP